MTSPGRIPLTGTENTAVEKLMAEHEGKAITLTRRDPDETGPLLVHVDDQTWEIADDGKRKKVT